MFYDDFGDTGCAFSMYNLMYGNIYTYTCTDIAMHSYHILHVIYHIIITREISMKISKFYFNVIS